MYIYVKHSSSPSPTLDPSGPGHPGSPFFPGRPGAPVRPYRNMSARTLTIDAFSAPSSLNLLKK